MSGKLGRLHVLTDAAGGEAALRTVALAVAAGAPVVQVRLKAGTDAQRLDFTRAVVELCAAHGALCLVNDRVDIALAAGAHGTHLGAEDLPVAAVRRIAGPDHLIGGTAREPRSAAAMVAAGVDYLGVGPAYGTVTKDGLPDPIGVAGVAAVAHAVAVPVIGIGGIDVARARELRAAGVYGVAVVGAINAAADPAAATRDLLAALTDPSPHLAGDRQ